MSVAKDLTDRFCIVGAGSSGLTVAKNFLEQGIACDCLEREDDLGGNWYYGKPHSSVYRSTHLISSKALTEYTDFPMPEEFPEFPSQPQVWEYLKAYARKFDLHRVIQFNTVIEQIRPADSSAHGNGNGKPAARPWEVTLASGERRRYRGVVIANGHNWDPKWPQFPGHFSGHALHSCEYKTPGVLEGKRVLVVGAGNSGCDIAVESALHAEKTYISMRRGYHFLPKFALGFPVDQCGERMLAMRLPLWLRRLLAWRITRVSLGTPETIGLPKPDHRLFETHPIINSQLPYYVGHGKIAVKPNVAELKGNAVRFEDGSEAPIDVIIYATGFQISFPFIDRELLNWRDGKPDLFLNVFHPRYSTLFVAGLIQPDSGQWGLVDYQAQLIARYVKGLEEGDRAAKRFQKAVASERPDLGRGINYVASTRHLLEVEHFSYRNRLKKYIRQLS